MSIEVFDLQKGRAILQGERNIARQKDTKLMKEDRV